MKRRLLAEAIGTGMLLFVIVGSGIAAEDLARDPGARLFIHAVAVGVALAALIAFLIDISGAHFNPAVTLAMWRREKLKSGDVVPYIASQLIGAFAGVVAAGLTFGHTPAISRTIRGGWGQLGAEFTATFILVLLISCLVTAGRASWVPGAVGAWVASAIVATSSTGFANPAVTVGRTITDTFTGITPASAPAFVAAQLIGALAAIATAAILYPKGKGP